MIRVSVSETAPVLTSKGFSRGISKPKRTASSSGQIFNIVSSESRPAHKATPSVRADKPGIYGKGALIVVVVVVVYPCERFKLGAHRASVSDPRGAWVYPCRALPKRQEIGPRCPGIVSVHPDDQRKLERPSI